MDCIRWVIMWLGIALLVAVTTEAAQGPERWSGTVDLSAAGQGQLAFTVTFTPGETGWSGRISIPAQGAEDLPLSDVVYGAGRIEFTLPTGAVDAVFEADRDGDVAEGTLRQGPEFPLRMERLAAGQEAPGRARPQHPEPPYPYEEREIGFENPDDGTRLEGTLTVPPGEGPYPAAVLISGSGAQDRDETIFGHKPFLVLADRLTRGGVAVLRYDDRGVGGSGGDLGDATSSDLAGDVLAAVRTLAELPGIDGNRIGLIGHSEGGLVAAMAAARSSRIRFVVMLAGPGMPGREILPAQLERLQEAVGRPAGNIERQLAAQEELLDRIVEGADTEAVRAALRRLTDIQLEAAPGSSRPDEEQRRQMVGGALENLTTPWFRAFLVADPATFLRRVRVPVLALNGGLDLQVPAEENLARIEAALREGGNDDVTVRLLPGLNHLFQPATTGSVQEYGSIEETMAPGVPELVGEWIRQRVGAE